jgi:tripartite-type tricarboxylate transporter receptor subunit TctC
MKSHKNDLSLPKKNALHWHVNTSETGERLMNKAALWRVVGFSPVVVAAMTGFAASDAVAQAYPTRPIRLIVPFPPGGSTDTYARIIGPRLGERLRQQVVIDNRAGAGGAIGAELASKAPADGYTIWLGQNANLATGPAMRPKNTYDPIRDFSPIALLMKGAQVFVVNAGSPITSIKDLIAAAKANPGKLTYGSAGIGSTGHMAGVLFNQMAGADIMHVPYKGASPAMVDLRGGRISFLSTSLPAGIQFVRDGKIKALATTGARRARLYPDTPTMAESGLRGFELTSWHGILGPAGVPPIVVARLNKEILAALESPEVQKILMAEGGDMSPSTPDEFAAFMRIEVPKWAKLIKQAGVTEEY